MKNIGIIKTGKFKNNAISLVIPVGLDENVTGYNVMAQLMKRGTKAFSSSSAIARYLQELYGAVFDIGLHKVGEKLFVIFYVSFLDNRFTLYKEDLWDKAIFLLEEVLYHPLFVQEDFSLEIISQELDNHRLYIESVYDDKGHYSMNRVVEIGVLDEYRIPEYGTLEELDGVTPQVLKKLWEDLLKKPAFCYASGNIEDEVMISGKLSMLKILKDETLVQPEVFYGERSFIERADIVYEPMKINQGKMSLLYKTNTTIFSGDYFALAVFNSIFGGGAHSKLFNEVREKHSMAYSIYSSFDKFAGVMTIGAGVDFTKFDRAKELIDEELQKMIDGEFTHEEMEIARTKMISTLHSMEDSMYNTSNYLIALRVFGIHYTVDDVIEGIKKVTKEQVIEAAKKVEFVCAHYLGGEELS